MGETPLNTTTLPHGNIVTWRTPAFSAVLQIGSLDELALARMVLRSYNDEPVKPHGKWPDMRARDVGAFVRVVMDKATPSPEQTGVAVNTIEMTADGWIAQTPSGRTVRHVEPSLDQVLGIMETGSVRDQLSLVKSTVAEVDGEPIQFGAWPLDCIDSTCLLSCMRAALFPTRADVAMANAQTTTATDEA